jgi:hypothetical protein
MLFDERDLKTELLSYAPDLNSTTRSVGGRPFMPDYDLERSEVF